MHLHAGRENRIIALARLNWGFWNACHFSTCKWHPRLLELLLYWSGNNHTSNSTCNTIKQWSPYMKCTMLQRCRCPFLSSILNPAFIPSAGWNSSIFVESVWRYRRIKRMPALTGSGFHQESLHQLGPLSWGGTKCIGIRPMNNKKNIFQA